MIRKKLWHLIVAVVFLVVIFGTYIFIDSPGMYILKKNHGTVFTDRSGNLLRVFLNGSEQYCFPPDKDLVVPGKLKKAVLAFEDKRFFYHPGFDPIAVLRASFANISEMRVVSGASTITMQVARIIEGEKRTVYQKIREIFIALKFELFHSKDEILATYLRYAPYGGNIIGYEAASWKYFRKKPEALSWAEAAMLAVLPNSPSSMYPGKNKDHLKAKRNRLLKKLFAEGVLSESSYELAVTEPIPKKVHPFGQHAHHITQNLLTDHKGKRVNTTIDLETQKIVEALVSRHQKMLSKLDIFNSAVIVADTESGDVFAWVGSGNFYDEKHGGQVDGVRAKRSSGSILKPFLYAMAIDEGVLVPETLIKDIPSYFGSFKPMNADHSYRGIISAKDALILSLNVPAVRILDYVGVNSFYTFLKQAGASTLFRSSDDYGLSLILGGAETTLLDLAMLYRGLGRYGKFQELKVLKDPERVESTELLLSQGASWMILDVLKHLYRPGSEFYWEQYNSQWPIAWKTGTSYGQRDAWAVGVSPKWTIAVWTGNFDGKGNADIAGARTSGPLLFDIFNSLEKRSEKRWFKKPVNEMVEIELCAESGFQAGKDCEEKILSMFPKDAKSLRLCPFHKSFFVTLDEKYRVNSTCWDEDNYKKTTKMIYPPDVSQYLTENGFTVNNIPKWGNNCTKEDLIEPLTILYPLPNSSFFIPRDFGNKRQKILMQVGHNKTDSTVFWYIDGNYYGATTKKHHKSVNISAGRHNLLVIDGNGYRKRVNFTTF